MKYSKKRNQKKLKKSYGKYRLTKRMPTGGFPSSTLVKLDYFETPSLIAGSVDTSQYRRYRVFGAYDPLFETGGTTPTNWSKWSGIYENYRVVSSKITVDFLPFTGSAGAYCLIMREGDGIYTIGSRSSFNDLCGNSKTTDSVACIYEPRRLSMKTSAKKMLGNSDVNLQAGIASLPTVDVDSIYSVIVHPIDNVTIANVPVKVHIEYIILFSDLKDQTF